MQVFNSHQSFKGGKKKVFTAFHASWHSQQDPSNTFRLLLPQQNTYEPSAAGSVVSLNLAKQLKRGYYLQLTQSFRVLFDMQEA